MGIRTFIYTTDNSKDTDTQKLLADDKQKLLADALCLYLSSTPGKVVAEILNIDKSKINELDLSLEEGEHGKPFFANEELKNIHFSISHSGKYWAIAFAGSEIGLDIEDVLTRKHNIERYNKISERFFTHDEISYIQSFKNEQDATLAFFRIWTRKEAFLKFTGEGISRQLNEFSTLSGSRQTVIDDIIGLETLLKTDEIVCSCCCENTELQDASIEFVQKTY